MRSKSGFTSMASSFDVQFFYPCMKLRSVKSEPQNSLKANRRISNVEYRMSKGGIASLCLYEKVMSAEG
jgi:hypothetical protein